MKAIIKLENVHKTYHTGEFDVKAVRGVSLEIGPGEFVAIMGASGSGKSTMMNIVGCLDGPTEGRYLLDQFPSLNSWWNHVSTAKLWRNAAE